MPVSAKARRWRLNTRGIAATEFAIVGGIFFLTFFAAIDLSRYFLTMHSLRTVVAQAARAAIVNTSLVGCEGNVTAAAGGSGFLGPSATLCITRVPATDASGKTIPRLTEVTVTATAPYTFIIPVFGVTNTTLSERQRFRFWS